MSEPRHLTVTGWKRRERTELNRLVDALKRQRAIATPGTRLTITDRGTSRVSAGGGRGGSATTWD